MRPLPVEPGEPHDWFVGYDLCRIGQPPRFSPCQMPSRLAELGIRRPRAVCAFAIDLP